MVKDKFPGTWKLVSFEAWTADGRASYPLGPDPTGVLMYDASGHFAGQVLRAGRVRFASDNMRNGTEEEVLSAYLGYIAYFGRYEVDEAEAVVTHHVEGSLYPNWMGGVQTRHFEFAGNGLILSTPPSPAGGRTFKLVWDRAG